MDTNIFFKKLSLMSLVWNNISFGSQEANKGISYTVLHAGFGTMNSWTARTKAWGNCDKQI